MNGKLIHQFSPRSLNGFSLIELLIVLVIIGLLAAAVGPSLYKRVKPAKQTMTRDQIQNFMVALDNYFIDTGHYPSAQQGLDVLRNNPQGIKGWDGPYLQKEIPKDPWGHRYIYRSPGRNGAYEIVSFGKDGVEGGEDEDQDINSWESN